MKLIFDIGCAGGGWTEKNLDRKTRFVCVEPNKETYREAANRFRYNSNVITRNVLLSDKEGVCKFYRHYNISTCSEAWRKKSRHSGAFTDSIIPINVKSVTLDSLIKEHGKPDYIKVDVEGYELNVFSGLTEKVGMITFEFVEEIKEATYACMKYLYKLGYKEWSWHFGDEYTYVPDKWVSYYNLFLTLKGMFRENRFQCWGMIYCK